MPASGKMLKNKAQRDNRAAGIGDEQGRLPSRVKAPNVNLKCTQCQQEIRGMLIFHIFIAQLYQSYIRNQDEYWS